MPVKAKSRLSGPTKRRKTGASTALALVGPNKAVPDVHEPESVEQTEGRSFSADARLYLYATLAWMHDYLPILKKEAEENGAVDAVHAHMSRYRAEQLKSAPYSAAFWESALRISNDFERLRREKNIKYISFSQVCVCAYNHIHVLT